MLGISFYFWLSFKPRVIGLVIFILSSLILSYSVRDNRIFHSLAMICTFFILGMLISSARSNSIENRSIHNPTGIIKVEGKVEKIYPLQVGKRVILRDVSVASNSYIDIEKAQITVRTKEIDEYKNGDYISLYASLYPVSSPMFPGSYNFARHAFFNKISANGYAVSKIKVLEKNINPSAPYMLERWRWIILNKINSSSMKHTGIASALMVGEQNGINNKVLSEMRKSGLTHILSVSGMHLTLVSIIVFFIIRYFLSHFVFFTQKYNIKKIAAWLSLFITLFYLLISGLQIAAIRSFIMVACIIIGVIIDREADSRRSLGIAAFVILLFTPEAVLYPSFQMSFAAVLGLISLYEIYKDSTPTIRDNSIFKKAIKYLFAVVISSFIAGTATSFFVIYHFGNYSNYSVIANLLVSPIVSCIIMPAVMLTFILFPFGQSYKLGLYVMDIGIDWMVKISHYISELPKSLVIFPQVSELTLFFFVLGFLWICLWRAKWRYIGIIPIALSLAVLVQTPFPSIIIDANQKSVLIKNEASSSLFGGGKTVSKKRKEQWSNLMDAASIIKMHRALNYEITHQGYTLDLTLEKDDKNRFSLHQLKINNALKAAIITKEDLESNGSYFIYLDLHEIKIQHSGNKSLKRPWYTIRKEVFS